MATKMAQLRLKQLREALVAKRRQLETEVGRSALYEKGFDEDATKDLGDQANTAYTREFQFELGNGDRRLLREVLSALRKLDEGGFGECERCGEPIGEKRLEALPFARYCIECQRRLEREDKAAAGWVRLPFWGPTAGPRAGPVVRSPPRSCIPGRLPSLRKPLRRPGPPPFLRPLLDGAPPRRGPRLCCVRGAFPGARRGAAV